MNSETPLLLTKINLPAVRAQWVKRERLLDRLDALRSARVILVSAPPGYGKTTLVASWLRGLEGVRPAWLALDQADNDPIRFWCYVVAALQASRRPAHPEMVIGQGFLELIRSPQPPPLENALVVLVNEITSSPAERLLVLDDYQVIENDAIHAGVRFLIENLPNNLHVVITTRTDPPFVMARYRARGWLAELRPADLRFNLAETNAFLSDTMRLGLAAQEVSALEERTDGWIAGLQLAALALQSNRELSDDERRTLISSFTGDDRFVMDYFTEEVLSRQPEELRSFLLKTAMLERFNAGLCSAVTGRADSQALIERLEQANLFIIPLDNRRGWYRYHPLFAGLLRSFQQQNNPAEAVDIHRKAAQWLADHALAEDAIHHALAAGELDEAADLLEVRISGWLEFGEVQTLLSWLERFPREAVPSRPALCLGYAWVALFNARFAEAKTWAERAASAVQSGAERPLDAPHLPDAVYPPDAVHPGVSAFHQGQIDLLLGTVAINQKDERLGIQLSQRALPLIPEEYSNLRSLAYLNIGDAANMHGQYQAAEEAFQKAYEAAHESGTRSIEVIIIGSLGNLYLRQGRLRQAERVLQQALLVEKDVRAQGAPDLLPVGKPLAYLACIYLEWNQLDLALETGLRALDLCARWGHPEHQMDALRCLADVYQAREETTEVRQIIARAWELLENIEASTISSELKQVLRSINRWRISQKEISLALQRDSLAEVENILARMKVMAEQPRRDIDWFEQGSLAWYWIKTGRLDEALPLLQQRHMRSQEQNLLWDEVGTLVQLALVYQALGQRTGAARSDHSQALSFMEQAVTMAKAEGFVRTFLLGGKDAHNLLAELLHRPGAADPDYIRELLSAFPADTSGDEDTAKSRKFILEGNGVAEEVDSLSVREMEILRLLASGNTYPEIAAVLYLSVNTVKTHVRRLYASLGVDNRLAAIDLARKRGLIR